jgi:hypothetical protein
MLMQNDTGWNYSQNEGVRGIKESDEGVKGGEFKYDIW